MDERLLHETKIHGTVEFPFAVYLGRVPEYVEHWKEDYPDEYKWYKLIIAEGPNQGNIRHFRAVSLNQMTIINALMNEYAAEAFFTEDTAVELCGLIVNAAEEAVQKIRDGTYNDEVNTSLPIGFNQFMCIS